MDLVFNGLISEVHTPPCVVTVEPLNKGHFGANSFVPCREVVPISEVKIHQVLAY